MQAPQTRACGEIERVVWRTRENEGWGGVVQLNAKHAVVTGAILTASVCVGGGGG